MVLAGLALAAFVFASWPEPTVRTILLPDGESMPKTPPEAVAAPQPAATTVLAAPVETPLVAVTPAPTRAPAVVERKVGRVLAAVEPDPTAYAGPEPVKSELELSGDYDQESPEELGAEPLPGADPAAAVLTPEQPPVAG